MKKLIALLMLIAAAGVCGYRLWTPSVPSENSLRDTAGIEATALSIQLAERGYRVQCRIVNHLRQFAEQVVLEVALVDANGNTLAANPLAGTSALAPGETRELAVFVPAPTVASNAGAKVKTSLVRWRN